MSATITGTPAAIDWGDGLSDPSGQSVTVPADATAAYLFVAGYTGNVDDLYNTLTLNGNSPSQVQSVAGSASLAAGFVAAWYLPSTGSQTLDPAWDSTIADGPTSIFFCTKDGDTTSWRDAQSSNGVATAAVSVTLTTVAGDLVVKFDSRFETGGAVPSLSSGWTNDGTQTSADTVAESRMSHISASGTSTVCDSEDEYYSVILAIAIPPAAVSEPSTGIQQNVLRPRAFAPGFSR